jgi:hypothetical protein
MLRHSIYAEVLLAGAGPALFHAGAAAGQIVGETLASTLAVLNWAVVRCA